MDQTPIITIDGNDYGIMDLALNASLVDGSNSYTLNSGTVHSSSDDVVDGLSITTGDTFFVYIRRTGDDTALQVFGNGVSHYTGKVNTTNKTVLLRLIAKNAIDTIGLYSSTRDSSNKDTVTFAVITQTSLLFSYLVTGIKGMHFELGANKTHGSSYDQISGLNLVKNETFYLYIFNVYDAPIQVFDRTNDVQLALITHHTGTTIHAVKTQGPDITNCIAIYTHTTDSQHADRFTYAIITRDNPMYALCKILAERDDEVENYINSFNYSTKISLYSSTLYSAGLSDPFIYFTDPHLLSAGTMSTNYDRFMEYTGVIGEFYNRTCASFVLCGGDWLEWNDTPQVAIEKLNLMAGRMQHLFGDKYYPVFGNHDSNYQGSEELSRAAIDNTMFPVQGRAYYSFKTPNARYYVLDSALDRPISMDARKWEQIDWYAHELIRNDDLHSAMCMHIFWYSDDTTELDPFANNLVQLAGAYNSRTTITLNSNTYDFTNCTGKIGFFLGGHAHADISKPTQYSVPIIVRTNTQAGGTPTFDLVIADWESNALKLVRVGTGARSTAETFTMA